MHPLEWFETLYQRARDEGATVPWADRVPNPHVVPMVKKLPTDRSIQRALKIGCGYGDDAEWLDAFAFRTAWIIEPVLKPKGSSYHFRLGVAGRLRGQSRITIRRRNSGRIHWDDTHQ